MQPERWQHVHNQAKIDNERESIYIILEKIMQFLLALRFCDSSRRGLTSPAANGNNLTFAVLHLQAPNHLVWKT